MLTMDGFLVNCTGIRYLNRLDSTNRYWQIFREEVLGKIELLGVGLYP